VRVHREVPAAAGLAEPGKISVEDPATGAIVGYADETTRERVAEVVRLAREAQPAWHALGFRGRAVLFRRARHWMLSHQDEILDSIVRENGKTREDAIIELGYCLSAFAYWASTARKFLARETIRSLSPFVLGRSMYVTRAPVGVVGVIGPWNNPLINSFGDAIPALAAGNAVVLKPSELTPLTVELMVRMARDCGWPGHVFQVVTGSGVTGQALADEADFVMFTGSTRTGRSVGVQAAGRLVPHTLELGGKDALIVLADAPLERAVNLAVHGSVFNAGQACNAIERIYVEDAIYEAFIDALRQRLGQLRTGPAGALGTVDVGAMTFPGQLDVIRRHVEDAVSRGARVLGGGDIQDSPGRFVVPALLVDVDHSMLCMREETFGPTLPVMRVRNAEEAIGLANDSEYGLQAAIVTRNVKRARELAGRLHAGCVTINDTQLNFMALGLPMGGWGSSGVGVRHGADGIRKYTRVQAVTVNARPFRRDLHMMPYRASDYRKILLLLRLLYGPRQLWRKESP
jgi:acyl-CoA reductase-like NAD-dependent aldehyde dehydrogenase